MLMTGFKSSYEEAWKIFGLVLIETKEPILKHLKHQTRLDL